MPWAPFSVRSKTYGRDVSDALAGSNPAIPTVFILPIDYTPRKEALTRTSDHRI